MNDLRDEGLCDDDASQDEPVIRYPVSCTNVPESLFDDNGSAAKHFGKFGPISKILLRPLKKSCIVEYERRDSAERAILNAGAYDGFMFHVTWSKQRKRTAVSDDPDWVPDADVAAELAAMSGAQRLEPRLQRQQKMEVEKSPILVSKRLPVKKLPIKKKVKPVEVVQSAMLPPAARSSGGLERSGDDLRQLVGRPWSGTEERLRALELRDRLLRAGLPPRLQAIRGCCPDMCPERERLARDFQRQVAVYEMGEDGRSLDPRCAVKQYSRSSADQEEPLAHDLRPVPLLQDTLLYLLHHIVDLCEHPQTSLEDWFHFLWDRLRAIRKDITQQALCCEGSVSLVEACARFHAHCAARLVEEPPSAFDQRLNTENLSKCLQSLKYMYGDLRARGQPRGCRREPEFRAYVVLLNMHDSNFMWEVQQLDPVVQRSPEIRFAIKVFTALDSSNYVKFFKLVKETTYLNGCILLRYFNDVRARALVRMIKSYSTRGISQFPASELMDILAFESMPSMELFLEHYGLQTTSDQDNTYVLLDKNAFQDNSTAYAQERAIRLVESKLKISLGEVIYGEVLPPSTFKSYTPHSSFEPSGFIKKTAILAEDQGYEPPKERALQIANLLKNATAPVRSISEASPQILPSYPIRTKNTDFTFAKPEIPKGVFSQNIFNTNSSDTLKKSDGQDGNLFKKATDDVENNQFKKQSSTNLFSSGDSKFTFSKPVETEPPKKVWQNQTAANLFGKTITEVNSSEKPLLFGGQTVTNQTHPAVFSNTKSNPPLGLNVFESSQLTTSIFGNKPIAGEANNDPTNIFNTNAAASSLFGNAAAIFGNKPIAGEANNDHICNTNAAASSLFGNAVANITSQMNNSKAIEEEQRRINALEAARMKKEDEEKRVQERIRDNRKQEELKQKIEERKIMELAQQKAELEKQKIELIKQKAEYERKEKERKSKELEIRIEKQLQEIIPELSNEVVQELCVELMEQEVERMQGLINYAKKVSEELITEVSEEECIDGIRVAVRLDEIRVRMICRSVARQWRRQVRRSHRRRCLLHSTPTWIPMHPPPPPTASQASNIQRMKAFHRGKLPFFRMPGAFKHHTINLFESVKKSLLKRSQELQLEFISLNVYWKVVVSVPHESESKKCFPFFANWFKDLFTDSQVDPHNHQIYLSENYWYKKFAISVCSVDLLDVTINNTDPKVLHAVSGLNGLLFYCNTNLETVATLMKRINATLLSKCDLECVPLAVVLIPDAANTHLSEIDSHLNQHKSCKLISEYKILTCPKFDAENISFATQEALKWLAKRFSKSPSIESELLSTFLDYCIGGELWYRFKLSLNSSYRKAFHDIKTLTELYNEGVVKSAEIASDPELLKYPVFPNEFREFLTFTHAYPKEYEYIASNWKSNIPALKKIISSFQMPQYSGEWPPLSFGDFQDSIRKFVYQLNWFSDPERIVLKIISITKDDPPDEEYSFNSDDDNRYSWIEIMNILVSEKITATIKSLREDLPSSWYQPDAYSKDFIVVYRPNDLTHYRTTPWWYASQCTQEICPVVEDFPDDMSELDITYPKRRKLNLSDDIDMPDEEWASTILKDMEETMKQTSQCHKMFTDLEKTLEIEKQRNIEFDKLLQSALSNG